LRDPALSTVAVRALLTNTVDGAGNALRFEMPDAQPALEGRKSPMKISSSPEIHLREARIDELDQLSDLCLRSKAVWGYDAAFLAACRDELTIAPEHVERTNVRVAERGGEAIGLAQVAIEGQVAELAKLFVEPDCLGQGCGRLLLDWAMATARDGGATRLTIDSDPGAVPFYTRMGARPVGLVPSGSIPGRLLPRLEIALVTDCTLSGSGSDAGRVTSERDDENL
jgi:GNAT superfamily N-acetyltransferase